MAAARGAPSSAAWVRKPARSPCGEAKSSGRPASFSRWRRMVRSASGARRRGSGRSAFETGRNSGPSVRPVISSQWITARAARPFKGRRGAWSLRVVLVRNSRTQISPRVAKSSRPMSSTFSAVTSDRRRPPEAKASISMARSRRPRWLASQVATSASSTSRVTGFGDFGTRGFALARRAFWRACPTSGRVKGETRLRMR
jgi:hypothetical protein